MFWPHAFSRAWRQLHVFASNSVWLVVLFTSVTIGQSNYLGFGFTTLNWKPLYCTHVITSLYTDYPHCYYLWFVDCPQVNALHNYTAQQPDELSLYEGDVINVLKKLPDGKLINV